MVFSWPVPTRSSAASTRFGQVRLLTKWDGSGACRSRSISTRYIGVPRNFPATSPISGVSRGEVDAVEAHKSRRAKAIRCCRRPVSRQNARRAGKLALRALGPQTGRAAPCPQRTYLRHAPKHGRSNRSRRSPGPPRRDATLSPVPNFPGNFPADAHNFPATSPTAGFASPAR